jgi:Ras family protein
VTKNMGDLTRIQDIHRKIAILGDVGVGKTSLAQRYTTGKFSDCYDPTIENCFSKIFLYNRNTRLHLDIVDTAGINDYSSNLSRNATIGVHGYLLVFSLYSRPSLEKVKVIVNLLLNALGDPPSVPIILVGTKCDLKDERYQHVYKLHISRFVQICVCNRVITMNQGKLLASELRVNYIECSSKSGDNVDELFKNMLNIVDQDLGMTTVSESTSENHKGCTVM